MKPDQASAVPPARLAKLALWLANGVCGALAAAVLCSSLGADAPLLGKPHFQLSTGAQGGAGGSHAWKLRMQVAYRVFGSDGCLSLELPVPVLGSPDLKALTF